MDEVSNEWLETKLPLEFPEANLPKTVSPNQHLQTSTFMTKAITENKLEGNMKLALIKECSEF